jgi:hypothetical protein
VSRALNPSRPRRRWLYAVAIPAIACCLLGVWSVGARAAVPVVGYLEFLPPTGLASSPITVQTVSTAGQTGCPAGGKAAVGWINGPAGSGWTNLVGLTTTSVGVSTTQEMTFPLVDTFTGIAAANSLTIVPGRYDIKITCLTSTFNGTELGDFVGSIEFTDATNYQALPPGGGPSPTSTTPAPTTSTPAPTTSTPAPTTPSPTTGTPTTPAPTTPAPTTSSLGLPDYGTITFLPPQGADVDPITAQTHSTSTTEPGCPTGTTFVDGLIFGPGDWSGGVGGVQRTGASVVAAVGSDFLIPLTDTFKGIAASNNLTIVPGRYDIVLTCRSGFVGQTPLGTFSSPVFFTDASHFQSTDPNAGAVRTTSTLTASPEDRADLKQEVTLTAQIAPATAVGTVQFKERISVNVDNVGSPVVVAGGKAVLKMSTFTFGLHLFSAAFVPADANRFATSSTDELVYVVAKPLPPLPPATATLSGRPAVGQTLRCAATFRNASSAITSWLRDGVTIPGATASSYRLTTADKGHQVACRVDATNAGGTTHRTSAYVRVTA